MSSALAIAAVTAVLRDLLNNGLIDQNISSLLGNVIVSALPPDRIDVTSDNQQSQLNLFLYQVTPNTGWRNVGLPSRNGEGERISNPPLALNLHYLLTAYGAQDLHSEILLGYGMQLLHETPVLPRAAIRNSLALSTHVGGGSGLPPQMQALLTSELAEQVEQVKIIPESLNTEEISRMWSAMQANYRPTAAYQATVVLIESRQSTKSALPVRARNIYPVPFNQIVIEEIKSQATAGDPILSNQPILAGYNLVLTGSGLSAAIVRVVIGGVEQTPAMANVSNQQIIVALPTPLSAGVHGVQVIHRISMGTPETPHRGFESNVAAFVLRPTIDPGTITFTSAAGPAPIQGTVTLTVDLPIGDSQRVVLILNQLIPISNPPDESVGKSYSFIAPTRPPVSPPVSILTIGIPVKGLVAGTYLVRVQIDGAESPLISNAAGQYVGPQVTIA
jgi:Pvc16 N-terminal domain/IPT/TIG domain